MNYLQDLERELKRKQRLLEDLKLDRNDQHYKENFYHIESGINSVSVDIKTLESRIANYGKKGISLPDHENVNTINKYK